MNAPYAPTLLAPLVKQFFTDRLMAQRNVSPRTVAAYRDTFRLLLAWFEQKLPQVPDASHAYRPGCHTDLAGVPRLAWKLNATTHIRSRNARFVALAVIPPLCSAQRARRLRAPIQSVLALPMKRFELSAARLSPRP